MARYLYIYFNRAPGKETTPVVREFFRFIHSKEGQEIVTKGNYIPLTKKVIDKKFVDQYASN
jgi:phosphate transport system substrate-binding protein